MKNKTLKIRRLDAYANYDDTTKFCREFNPETEDVILTADGRRVELSARIIRGYDAGGGVLELDDGDMSFCLSEKNWNGWTVTVGPDLIERGGA